MNVPTVIDSIETYNKAQHTLETLLKDGAAGKAVDLADRLAAGRDQGPNVKQLRACAYVDGGEQLKKAKLVEKGAQMFRELSCQNSSPGILYNLASAELKLWQLAVAVSDLGTAWLNQHNHLREARKLFDCIANDKTTPVEFRLKALTDAGNSYDNVGRYLDAIEQYDRALRIDPSFGMALGNLGMTLHLISPLMGSYASCLQLKAAAFLDAAIDDQEGVLIHGGQSALDKFQELRSVIEESQNEQQILRDSRPSFADPYLAWCLKHELFLHVSPNHIREDTEILDSISFKSFKIESSNEGLQSAYSIIDAFNTLKQDYIAARYLLWLATANNSPISEHARVLTKRVSFWDTASYARFSTRTGLVIQSHKAAVDLLDKIAAFVHLYFSTNRKRGQVSFDNFPSPTKGKLSPALANALKRPEQNMGLMALLDLNSELKEDPPSPLKKRVIRRHSSTHMFLVAHNMMAADSVPKVDRVNWGQLIQESLDQLRFVRGAFLYLANMIEIHEDELQAAETPSTRTMPLPIGLANPDFMEPE